MNGAFSQIAREHYMAADGRDPQTPSPARMYDYYLGGKDHYPADLAAAEQVLNAAPSIRDAAINNRRFLARAVDYCATAGVGQFIDIGTGIPTFLNVADVARSARPDAAVVGIDNDSQLIAHDNALLHGVPIVDADICRPDEVIDHPRLNAHIDWRRPVAVLFVAILHFLTEADDPAGVVAAFRERMAPGSFVVISHVSSSGADADAVAEVERVYQRATSPGVFRTIEQITAFFDGFTLLSPGVVPVENWPWKGARRTAFPMLGGIGHIPTNSSASDPFRRTRLPTIRTVQLWSMLSILAPNIVHHYREDPTGEHTAWMVHTDGSWARATGRKGTPPVVHQAGPRRLWDILDDIRHTWLSDGSLPVYGAHVTITPDGVIHLRRGRWKTTISA